MTRAKLDILRDVAKTLLALERLPANERAREAHRLGVDVLTIQARLVQLRRSGVRGMRAAGMTYAAIAEDLDLSPTRVQQIDQGLSTRRKENASQNGT